MSKVNKVVFVVAFFLVFCLLFPSFASAAKKWGKNTQNPEFLQRGAGLYSYVPVENMLAGKGKIAPEEFMKLFGDNFPSIIHDFVPYVGRSKEMSEEDWGKITDQLRKYGVINIVRIEGVNFFENEDVNDTYKRITGNEVAPPFGFYYSWHGYRHNLNWFEKFPETKLGSLVRRDATDSIEYYGSTLVERRTGAYMNPYLMKQRREYVLPYLTGKYTFPYDRLDLKEVLYRKYQGVYYDNHTHWLDSYDPWSLSEAKKYIEEKVGYPSWDPADDPNPAARRLWNEFFANKYIEYYLEHQRWCKKELEGGPYYCVCNGKAQFCPMIAPLELLGLSLGTVDGWKCEDSEQWSFGYKAGIAFSQGRPVHKFGGYDVIEAMANRGIPEWYSKDKKEEEYLYNRFYKTNPEIYKFCNPGGSVAILILPWTFIRNGQYELVLDLSYRLDRLGVPYEVATHEDLAKPEEMASNYPIVILLGGEVTEPQSKELKTYIEAEGTLIHMGDSYLFKPADWRKALVECSANLKEGPLTPTDLTDPTSPKLKAAWGALYNQIFPDRIGPTLWNSILPELGIDPFKEGKKQLGKGKMIHSPEQIPSLEWLKNTLKEAGGYHEYLIDPTGACQVTKSMADGDRAVIYHIVNYTNNPAKGVKLQCMPQKDAQAIFLCPNLLATDLALERGPEHITLTLPDFDKYAVVVISSDAKLLSSLKERELARIKEIGGPRRVDLKAWRPPKDDRAIEERKPDNPGYSLYYHRMAVPNLRRVVSADIEYPREAKVGTTAEIKMKILKIAFWTSKYVYFEEPRLVFRHMDTLESEFVEFPNFPMPDEENFPKQAGHSLQGKTFSLKWTPKKPGRYEVFLQYRYTDTIMEGEANFAPAQGAKSEAYGKPLRNYFKGEPRQKIRYTDRLSPVFIVVSGAGT